MEEKVIVNKRPKSPGLAGVISFFLPTCGALYNGQILKWLIYLLTFAVLVTMQDHHQIQPFIGLILGAFYIYQLVDAVQTAKAINRRALSEEKEAEAEGIEEIPPVFKAGSIFWGIFLMALGGIFLFANFEIIDYGSVFDLWPVAVIVIGVKLIVDYFIRK